MARPKSTLASQQLTDELARLEQARRELIERRRQAVAAEDTQRGEIVRKLLQGSSGRDVAALLHRLVSPGERLLFNAGKEPATPSDGADSGDGPDESDGSAAGAGRAPSATLAGAT